MKNTKKVSVEVGGKQITFETGVLAKQANGSLMIQMDETIVFTAVTAAKSPREGIDFFPLQVEYREKFYAAGRFPGGFFKREARPSEKEILTMRATDRPIRPLFPKGYFNDVQINSCLMSTDGENDPDILSINAASAALMISDIPFMGPIGAVRIGRIDGNFVLNPTHEQSEVSDMNLTYVGNDKLPMMIEGDALEASNEDMLSAMRYGQEAVTKLCEAQLQLRRECGLEDKVVEVPVEDKTLINKARKLAGDAMSEALRTSGKLEREGKVKEVRTSLNAQLLEIFPDMTEQDYFQMFDDFEIDVVRHNVIEHGHRIDGRAFDELRPLEAQVGFLPRTHGSSLFQRGETQSLSIVTLGTSKDAQSMDAVSGGSTSKNFLLHYNFPPYSVGECGRLGFTSRREIGHGNLAERSLKPVIPTEYPYSIRLVSEIMESNGSSSMASVCAGTLALMDAGVPISKPVGGISVGLFTDGKDRSELVIDILGAEDHCGEMDFKVCGTRDGVTGFQVDLKLGGLEWDIVAKAFDMAHTARLNILDYMASIIDAPRAELSIHAPRIETIEIPTDKIGALIGPGGKNIRRITDTYGVQIDIDDAGIVSIFSSDGESMKAAVEEVSKITAEAEVGKLYNGTVTGVKDFGAFVEILPGKDGLVHISELADFRVNTVTDICKVGDAMWVKCIGVDDGGKIRLSRKAALAEKDAEATAKS